MPEAAKPDQQRALQDLRSFRLPPGFRGRPAIVVLVWQLVQATLFGLSPRPMYAWRSLLLRLFGAKIGKGVEIRPTSRIAFPWKLEIGNHVWISDNTELYSLAPIRIGSHSVISQRSYLCAAKHDHHRSDFAMIALPIIIGEEVWVATDVFIAPGITIGDGAVVGARSSVFADVPSRAIVHGTPARIKGWRGPNKDGGPEPKSSSSL